jgi:methyl-accepting chemotaxis protein
MGDIVMAADGTVEKIMKEAQELQELSGNILVKLYQNELRCFQDVVVRDDIMRLRRNLEILVDVLHKALKIISSASDSVLHKLSAVDVEGKKALDQAFNVIATRADRGKHDTSWISRKEFEQLLKEIKALIKTYGMVKEEKKRRGSKKAH